MFYQTTPDYLPLYHENGYRFFKLGEEALVDLSSFTLRGKRNAALRAVHNRFEQEGFRFEVASPPHQEKLMERLKYISDQWLRGKKEKGFSIGWFDENYLQLAPLALIIDQENKVIAFASVAPVYDHDVTLSVDLMRHLPEVPNGTMDQLFISLFEFAREQGTIKRNLRPDGNPDIWLIRQMYLCLYCYSSWSACYHASRTNCGTKASGSI
ncbi:phosphatidylglycerol lysyltransferase domain-containing protein [Paenibacillus lutimineralis]|uniref:phosphatidylglycerol lysyltransferase domain-containing protein n=1 Tax=Paenibacillus lutimineralis TaxID=2707005 RepID=UPI001F35A5E8|nr:phosphatidylglycerol lysyltransferase domain-containing protein [Paenibacillus lutimineralis]